MVRPGKMAGPAEVAKNLMQEKLIMKAADKIGIDLIKEPFLRWIAEYATHPEVPDDWVSCYIASCESYPGINNYFYYFKFARCRSWSLSATVNQSAAPSSHSKKIFFHISQAEFQDDHGELAYFNQNTKVLKRTHPVLGERFSI